jgi:hypothetical protein
MALLRGDNHSSSSSSSSDAHEPHEWPERALTYFSKHPTLACQVWQALAPSYAVLGLPYVLPEKLKAGCPL